MTPISLNVVKQRSAVRCCDAALKYVKSGSFLQKIVRPVSQKVGGTPLGGWRSALR